MKKILILLAVWIPLMCFSQTDSIRVKEYCSVKFVRGGDAARMTMKDSSFEIKDANGKSIKFHSDISLINYVAEQGWELHPISIYYSNSTYGKYYEYVFWRYKKNEQKNVENKEVEH